MGNTAPPGSPVVCGSSFILSEFSELYTYVLVVPGYVVWVGNATQSIGIELYVWRDNQGYCVVIV